MHRLNAGRSIGAGLVLIAATAVAFTGGGVADADPVTVAAPWDRDAQEVAATKHVPGFGGAYLDADGSTTHVLLTRPDEEGAARSRAALAGLGLSGGTGKTVVHRADYTFAQLKIWRDATRSVFALPSVTSLEIDERRNRVVVGLEDPDRHSAAVRAAVTRLGIPEAAVTAVRRGAVTMTVRDQTRPLHGGTQIVSTAALPTCTLGYPATRQGVAGFVTNSHCSANRGVVDNGRFWQPTRPAGDGGVVGLETADTAVNAGLFDCPVNRRCASADANFVAAQTGVNISQGRIARPAVNSTNWNGTDTFRVTAADGGAALNSAVQKVGRTTGRTTGTVTGTCVDFTVNNTDIYLFCQQTASYNSAGGDSGSPVFRVTNSPATNDVTAVGVNWGNFVNGAGVTNGIFSGFGPVEREIGALNICAAGFAC
ncbi:hypothetical protein [Jidongwangia harbinensis]|uniref:hypothetical protein n=1 Tax=Jidongwangia harbinensis TaxID=2878561 RepID=UPI001CD9F522|nr:hypothetical protein [Jidongwangia harbinensis]MCA2211308.1 hypothetical protein [Jidongwangia harbinensis]